MTNRFLRDTIAALAWLIATASSAHEFWMAPDSANLVTGSAVRLRMFVGENYNGERVGFYRALVARVHHYSAGVDSDLANAVGDAPAGELAVTLANAGTHMVVLDTHPSQIELPADRFHAYLHDEGLDFIVKARERAGTAATPGRERYRRNIKTLVRAGGRDDSTFSQVAGQRLEIIAQSNPGTQAPGQDMTFEVRFEGRPLAGALVKFWHRRQGQLLIVRTTSDAQGRVVFTPPWQGEWMASVVHMIAATDSKEVDWDSFWGNLTFALPPQR